MGWLPLLLRGRKVNRSEKRHGLDARHIKPFPAAHVLTHDLVLEQDHIAGSLGELGAVALVGMARQAVDLGPDQPLQVVGLRAAATRAVQRGGLGSLGFFVKGALVHRVYYTAASSATLTKLRSSRRTNSSTSALEMLRGGERRTIFPK